MASTYEPEVRPATVDDLPDLVRLARLAHAHLAAERGGGVFLERDARPSDVEPSLRDDLALAADPAAGVLLVGGLGAVPAGYAAARIEPTRGRPLAVVTDLFVEPGARGVGLGRALMQHLVDWAEANGCGGIDADALPGDRATKNFFEGFGLVARSIRVHRALGHDGPDSSGPGA